MNTLAAPARLLFALLLFGASLIAVAAQELKVLNIGERTFDGAPAIAVILSHELDAERLHDRHLSVQRRDGVPVRGAWVLAENRRILYFPSVEPQTEYVVQVKVGLVAQDGSRLEADRREQIVTRKIAPGLGFATQGLVLPRDVARGLPVVAVNVRAVDIDFLRIPPNKLATFLNAFGRSSKTSNFMLDTMRKWGQVAYSGRFELDGRPNQRATSLIPVLDIPELQAPGLYVAVMGEVGRYRHQYDTAYYFVSDIGLVARQYKNALVVFASSLARAQAETGVTVELTDGKGNSLDRAVTDTAGKVRLTRSGAGRLLVARKGDDVALLPLTGPALDLSEFAVATGRLARRNDIFVYTPRDLFRPGETVEFSALLRDWDGRLTDAQPLSARLHRPDGRLFRDFTWQAHLPGYYHAAVSLPDTTQTGTWNLDVRTDPGSDASTTRFTFRVEEFLPERLKLDLESDSAVLAPDQPLRIEVDGAYLYGAPAAGNRLDAVVMLERQPHPVAALSGFVFGDAEDDRKTERRELESIRLDDAGHALIELQPFAEQPGSPMAARVVASLFETGGRSVSRSITRTVWPAPALIGVRALFDGDTAEPNSDVRFEVVKSDPDGQRLTASGLDVKLIKEDRDYYWVYDENRGWHSEYNEANYPVDESVLDIAAGELGQLRFAVEYGAYRLEILDPETGLRTRVRFYAGWSWQSRENMHAAVRPDKVTLQLDRAAYRAGDEVQLTLRPPHAGEALILVESDRLLWSRRVSVSAAATTVSIPVAADWNSHDIYISALVLRPASAATAVTPSRALGMVHLPIDREPRRIAIELVAPDEIVPQSTVHVQLQSDAASEESAYVTLAAVDVGVLNITEFATPDPWAYFFGQRRYGVESRDIYGQVIEAFDGSLAKLRFGGDTDLTAGGKRPEAKVSIVSLFQGAVALDREGRAEIPLHIPDFNGRLRLMAVVFGQERFGSAEREMTVAAPVVAELATPRFLAAGDRSTATLDLHNLSGGALELEMKLFTEGPLILGPVERRLALADDERRTLSFALHGGGDFGVGKILLELTAPEVELRRSWELAVRPAYPAVHRVDRRVLQPGERAQFDGKTLEGLMHGGLQMALELSPRPALNLRGVLRNLLQYPYGCLEQTTSRAYPLLYVDEAVSEHLGLEPMPAKKRLRRVTEAIDRIRGMQLDNGGFGLWSERSPEEPWLTPFVADFLLDARGQGYEVPAELLQKVLERLERRLRSGGGVVTGYSDDPRHLGFAVNAYGAYVLARVGRAPLGALRTLYDKHQQDATSGLPLTHLGLALLQAGDHRRATQALTAALEIRRASAYLGDYGSAVRDTAMMIRLLAEHGPSAVAGDALWLRLADELKARRWLSTQERLAVFLAGGKTLGDDERPWSATLSSGTRVELLDQPGTWRISPELARVEDGLTLTNRHDGPLFLTFELNGYPAVPPAPEAEAVHIERRWYTAEGEPVDETRPLEVGELIIVHLALDSRETLHHGLTVDLLPAGLEIENLNIGRGEGLADLRIDGMALDDEAFRTETRHQEFRDDRYVAALELRRGRIAHLFYLARAVTPGMYVVPPPFAEDMYRPWIRAIGSSVRTLTVAK